MPDNKEHSASYAALVFNAPTSFHASGGATVRRFTSAPIHAATSVSFLLFVLFSNSPYLPGGGRTRAELMPDSVLVVHINRHFHRRVKPNIVLALPL